MVQEAAVTRMIARVIIESPLPQLDRLFDYAVPPMLADEVQPGVRVRVPLRSAGRVVDAYVVETATETDHERALSEVDAVVSAVRVLPERLAQLTRRVADRAGGSTSDVLRLVIPKRQVRVEKAWLAAGAEDASAQPIVGEESVTRAHAVLDQYEGLRDALAARERIAVEAIPQGGEHGEPQWAQLLAAAASATLAGGASTILVVPDYRDLERVLTALEPLVPAEAIVRLDARQSNPVRYRAFLRTLESAPCVVIGNRSSIYAPANAGLVAFWDDGDNLLSEPLAPYVHSRDVGLLRQEAEGSALMFAGHTRTTDVERLVLTGWVREITATRRVTPRVILDSVQELDQRGQRLPSRAFVSARDASSQGPVLIQVARPGFAPSLVCGQCRTPARCTTCGGPMGAAHRGALPVCGWCARTARAWACSSCGSEKVRLAASGSERTAEELGRAFPGVRVIVADGTHTIERVDARPALVVATRGAEPLAEGGYRAVVLLDGSRMLQAPDLRVGESCLRWWSNAAALAAPGAPIHLVGVDGPVARALATWTQPAYARSELAARAPLRMPPTSRVAQLDGTDAGIRRALEALSPLGLSADAILGPLRREDEPERQRALVRFDYANGARVVGALRAAVIAEASGRRRGRERPVRTTLTVRLDVIEPDL